MFIYKYHKNLMPKLWNQNNELDKLACQSLKMIAYEFIKYLNTVIGLPITHADVYDVYIHGSCTNYYWDKHSDIDLCIVANLTKLRKKISGINEEQLFNSLVSSWRRNFRIKLYGRRVDIKLKDKHDRKNQINPVAGCHYSLFKNDWEIPVVRLGDSDLRQLKRDAYRKYRVIMRQCKYLIKHKMSADFVNAYLVELRNLRNTYMLDYAQQPITSYAIAYKAVRNTGILNKLYKMARTDQSKKYNLV